MEEKRSDAEYGSDIEMKSPFLAWLDNFWYHYKWHTIVALFLIISILICSLQMCGREEIDFHMMYAGSAELPRRSTDGDTPVYNQVINVLKRYIDDVDGDGKKNMAFTTYFSLSPEEIDEIEATPGKEVNYTLLQEDATALNSRFGIGDYSLSLVSPYVYEEYKGTDDVCVFMPIAQYAPAENGTLEYYSEYAVYLRSTAMYKNNVAIRNNLPEDTLIVLRIKSAAGGIFNGSKNNEAYEMAEEVLRRILAEYPR